MSVLSSTLALGRLRSDDPAWSLLRAEHAPIIAAVLEAHLGGEKRRLPAPELFELVEQDLLELNAYGFDLPRTAQAYCTDWRNMGILVRRPAEEARTETFELSPGALTAIRFLSQLAEPRRTATQSRLATIADGLRQLANDTDPDVTSRLAQLQAERDRIDAQIELVLAGDIAVLDVERSTERAVDLLALAEEIPSDFARVRADLEGINRGLRERILDNDETQSRVLDEVFRGVDLVAESEAGRSFAGFSAMVLDPELSASFEESIERVLSRTFAQQLSAAQRRFLRRLLRTMKEQSREIHEVMTSFSRGLRRFVQSQDYQQDRVIKRLLREGLAEALPVANTVRPYIRIGFDLQLSSVAVRTVGALALHNPADLETTAAVLSHADAEVDIDVLKEQARATEIDMVELTRNVNAVLADRSSCTIGEVLDLHPASQGVASVIGLLVLAEKRGVQEPGSEQVHWFTKTGSARRAEIPRHRFTGRLA